MLRKVSLLQGLKDVLVIICLAHPLWSIITLDQAQDFDRYFQLNALRLNPGSSAPEIEILENTRYDIRKLNVSFWVRPAPGTVLANNIFFIIRNQADRIMKFRNNDLRAWPTAMKINLQLTEFTLNSKMGYQNWFQVVLSFDITAAGSKNTVLVTTREGTDLLEFSNEFDSIDNAYWLYFGLENAIGDPNLISTT